MIPQRLRDAPLWCVSKDKEPLDMWALARGRVWGASNKRSHSSYTDYKTASEASVKTGYPMTLYVDTSQLAVCVLDIEKTCPATLRRAMLLSLHDEVIYLETSLSGKGFHLVLKLPAPEEMRVMKFPSRWFEVLASHHCTFTGNEITFDKAYSMEIPENAQVPDDGSDVAKRSAEMLEAMSKPLTTRDFCAMMDNGNIKVAESLGIDSYRAALSNFDGRHADLFNSLCDMLYTKTVDGDFHGDWSSYEFGYASKMHYQLQRMAQDMIDEDCKHYQLNLTKEEAVMLVYMALKQVLPSREKHKTVRNGLPWLLYTSERVYAKTFE